MNNIKSLEDYKNVSGEEVIEQLKQLAAPLRGLKITHVNSTPKGGGVAEILEKLVPMASALGLDVQWKVIEGTPEFYQCTKSFHNAIQGIKNSIPEKLLRHFEEVNKQNAVKLGPLLESSDIVFIHDPQPCPLATYCTERKGKWIWRCHVDVGQPFRPVWQYLKKFIDKYDAAIFSLPEFVRPMNFPVFIIPPSIDPLSDKNIPLEQSEIDSVYNLFQLDPKRPILLQVSRFDRFKDPVGVIEAYHLIRKKNPDVQLVLAGGEAQDDPEGDIVLNEVRLAARGDPDIHILLLPSDAHRTINALQRAATIVIQKSLKEGFGLTVTEALWKGKPVIGGNAGGIRLQVINSQTGFIVDTPEGAAYHIRNLLQHPEKAQEMGIRGREFVRDKFLLTRLLRDELAVIYSIR